MSVDNKLVNYGGLKEQTKLTLERALLWDKGIMGGFAGDFPLSSARKGSVYRVPATNKWYVCTENYNGSQISTPNQQFTELSVFKNADRLDNLIKKKKFNFKIKPDQIKWTVDDYTLVEIWETIDIPNEKIIALTPGEVNGFRELAALEGQSLILSVYLYKEALFSERVFPVTVAYLE